ncbi:hypothetical protein HYU10_00875 [Candidatus Woesearchaeota archaeon]|nr:hypothetical protein [Candidatus Woesearchaeota archaeon]
MEHKNKKRFFAILAFVLIISIAFAFAQTQINVRFTVRPCPAGSSECPGGVTDDIKKIMTSCTAGCDDQDGCICPATLDCAAEDFEIGLGDTCGEGEGDNPTGCSPPWTYSAWGPATCPSNGIMTRIANPISGCNAVHRGISNAYVIVGGRLGTTNPDGKYEIVDVPIGGQQVTVFAQDYNVGTAQVHVEPGSVFTIANDVSMKRDFGSKCYC